MSQRKRILIAVCIVVVLVGVILGIDALRRGMRGPELPAGSIPIYVDGELVGGFTPDDLEQLEMTSFVEPEKGKTQEGWLLRDVLLIHVDEADLQPDTLITVSSSSREKSAQLTWAEVSNPDNMVMFDLSNRGTLKLVSVLEKLDTRDEWVQDTDKIEVAAP
jgi:hypothetical protein